MKKKSIFYLPPTYKVKSRNGDSVHDELTWQINHPKYHINSSYTRRNEEQTDMQPIHKAGLWIYRDTSLMYLAILTKDISYRHGNLHWWTGQQKKKRL